MRICGAHPVPCVTPYRYIFLLFLLYIERTLWAAFVGFSAVQVLSSPAQARLSKRYGAQYLHCIAQERAKY
jgi:hypothetical protein